MRSLRTLLLLLLGLPCAVSAQVREGDVVVLDTGASFDGEIFLVEPSSGTRRRLAPPPFDGRFGIAGPIAQDVLGWLYVSDGSRARVARVDPVSGRRSIFSGGFGSFERGSGPSFDRPQGLAIAPAGPLFVVDPGLLAVLSVDPDTGDRAVISSNDVGSGPGFDARSRRPESAALDPTGQLLVSIGAETVYGIDVEKGARTILTGPEPADPALAFSGIRDLVAESAAHFLVLSSNQEAVFRVDTATGARSVVSSSRAASPRGEGPAFDLPSGVAVAPDGEILVANTGDAAVLGVDPVTGDRRTVSRAPFTGGGQRLESPRSLLVAQLPDPGAPGPLLAIDSRDFVYDVEPETGFLIQRGQLREAGASSAGVSGFFIGFDRGPDGRIYGMTTASRVYTIDAVTLEAEIAAELGGSNSEGDVAFRPETGELYAVGGRSEGIVLIRIDLEAETFVVVTTFDLSQFNSSAMVFRPDGLLAVVDSWSSRVVTVDPDTGDVLAIQDVIIRPPGGVGRTRIQGSLGGAVLTEDESGFLIVAGDGLHSLPIDSGVGHQLAALEPGFVVPSGLTRFDNGPPEADAGEDQVVECMSDASAEVGFDGTGSSDPDGDPLTWTWTGAFGVAEGPEPTAVLGLGTDVVTLLVEDGAGGSDEDTVEIEVRDGAPPRVEAALKPLRARSDDDDDDDDAGPRFEVAFSCSDACDPEPTATARVDDLPVSDGEVVALHGGGGDDDDGAPLAPVLSVRCEDAGGNVARVEARPPVTSARNDDDDGARAYDEGVRAAREAEDHPDGSDGGFVAVRSGSGIAVKGVWRCGLGFELVFVLPPLWWWRRRRAASHPANITPTASATNQSGT
ncbi:MAG: hypothetical protein QNK04_30515 [Myxococcota bacterium]|nr:hypothetical protein [Myxococcota bacterium]